MNSHGDGKSPRYRVIPVPNGLFMAYKSGVSNDLMTYTNWNDPPIRGPPGTEGNIFGGLPGWVILQVY